MNRKREGSTDSQANTDNLEVDDELEVKNIAWKLIKEKAEVEQRLIILKSK